MQRQIPIREVNQHLSRYIEFAEQGEEIVITRRGRPVARLVAIDRTHELSGEQEIVLARSLARMRKGYDLGGQRRNRDELHER